MSNFKQALESGTFVVTAELEPPKGVNTERFLRMVDTLKDHAHAINIPDNRSARLAMSSVAASSLAKQRGAEPICTFTCRDRNRLALSSDLLGACALGLTNILLVSGDYFTFGDMRQAKPVFDLDSVQAMQMARDLEKGADMGGNQLDGPPAFCLGGVANPSAEPIQPQAIKFLKKIRTGVDFIQTLDIYDLEKLKAFREYTAQENIKIIAGVRIVGKHELELQEAGKLAGVPIPRNWVQEMSALDDEQAVAWSKQQVVGLIKAIKSGGLAAGIHLTADGREDLIPGLLKEAGL